MKRYLIILIAILVGLIAFALIEKFSRNNQKGIKTSHIIGAFISFFTLAIGLYILELSAAPPDAAYVPAKLIDGKVMSPEFITPKD